MFDEVLSAKAIMPRGWRPDPPTLVCVVVFWCLISSLSFFVSTGLVQQRLYHFLADVGLTSVDVGSLFLLDAAVLLMSLYPRASSASRSFIAISNTLLWLWIGSKVIRAGVLYDIYPRSGMADAMCGLICGFASVEWPYNGRVPPNA